MGSKRMDYLLNWKNFKIFLASSLGILCSAQPKKYPNVCKQKTFIQDNVKAINIAKGFYRRQRAENKFDRFYSSVEELSVDLDVGEPQIHKATSPIRQWNCTLTIRESERIFKTTIFSSV